MALMGYLPKPEGAFYPEHERLRLDQFHWHRTFIGIAFALVPAKLLECLLALL
jgi:hypothetical protein